MSTETPRMRSERSPDTDASPLLKVTGLKKHFEQSGGFLDRMFGEPAKVRAVDGVDLTIRDGETVAVVGESGCGKSTLGRTILNLHRPTAGSVQYRGEDLAGLSERKMQPYRRRLQMIFQDPLASLNPRQRVGEILKAPMEVHGIGENDNDRTERTEELLTRVGLKKNHIDRYPHQFSGGQQQRIGIARALSLEPDLIVADEPVSALDVSVQAQIINLLGELQDELELSLLFIAHDLSIVRHIADRVAVMYLGRIVETAPVTELFENPQHPYTQSLLSAVPRIDMNDRTDRVILEGTVPSPLSPPSGCRFHTRCPVVIPPEDWPGTQEQFKQGFTFRNRIVAGEIDVGMIRTGLQTDSHESNDSIIASRIIEQSFPGDPNDLPDIGTEAVQKATDTLVAGEDENAINIILDVFESPCEQTVPKNTAVDTTHLATCHRVDPDAPGSREPHTL